MRKLYLLILGVLCAVAVQAQQTITITDNGSGTGTTTWTAGNTYILDGFVFVNDGQMLTIEPGTVIKGKPGQGASASALIVARGGTIMAEGTPSAPIIFTAESDDVTNPFDIPVNTTGLWGGVIILGNASLNSNPGETAIEGIPTSEPRGLYGAIDPNGDGDYSDATFDDADNSGVFRYVSIRHGGTDIGAGNEINGLTLGGVGSGTTIDHIEVIFNADDGVEFFGGTVNISHVAVAFVGDDSYDYDEGFRGKGQFWFTIQNDGAGSDRCGEHDGGTSPETAQPYATPQIWNATYIGRGALSGKRITTFRDNAGGYYKNGIFVNQQRGIDVEILGNGDDSYDRFVAGELVLENNLYWNIAGNNASDIFAISAAKYSGVSAADSTAEVDAAKAAFSAYFATAGNANMDPQLNGVSNVPLSNGLDPRPAIGGAAYQNLADYPAGDDFIQQVSYKGAFGSSPNLWIHGWTYLDQLGYLPVVSSNLITVSDNTGAGTTTWTKNNTYFLDGFVFVNPGDTLIIEPGTVIKGLPGQGADASALIVARGGYIMAEGTRDEPIILTGSTDDVANPFDIPINTTGLWGGLIVLGNASLNSNPGETAIEGIPTTEPRGLYGALNGSTNDADNSGVIRYVSIRHGGTDIGAGNEINGLTLGGVGSGTTIDHVEVIFNADDGVEFFGGLPQLKNISVAFVGDDSYDYDEGFRGKGQFWFAIQSDAAGSDRLGEHDGGTSPETATPYATPTIFNATYIGRGAGAGKRVITFRDNAGGTYANSIFAEQDRGIDIEILGNGDDSYDRFVAGELKLMNNVFSNVAASDLFTISAAKYSGVSASDSTAEVDAAKTAVSDYFATAGNVAADAGFVGMSYSNDNTLDPRPQAGVAFFNMADLPAGDNFFTPVTYKGAFASAGADFWLDGWTYMDFLGYFPSSFAATTDIASDLEPLYTQVYPNPNNGVFTVEANGVKATTASIRVLSLTGAVMHEATAPVLNGTVSEQMNLENLPAALYIVELRAGDKLSLQRLVIK